MKAGKKRISPMPSPWTTPFGVGWLLVVSALCAWMTAALRTEPVRFSTTSVDGVREQVEEAGFRIVDTPGAEDIAATGSHLILDARPRADFAEGHLPGAISLPINDFAGSFPEVVPLLMGGMPVLVYCTGPLCDDALRLGLRLEEAGFPEITVYVEGMEGWNAEAGP